MFLREACELNYPEHCVLFVDRGVYDYYRWHLMGIIAYHINRFEEGKSACLKAIAYGDKHKAENERNLKFYTDAEVKGPGVSELDKAVKEISKPNPNETKNKFLERTVQELKVAMPNTTIDKLQKRALALWKKRKE